METVITGDVEDYLGFEQKPQIKYEDLLDVTLEYDEAVDDVHIFIIYMEHWPVLGSGTSLFYRPQGEGLPIYGIVILGPGSLGSSFILGENLYVIALHELAHALGFSSDIWNIKGLLFNPSKDDPGADTYFFGLDARKSFNQVGGLDYRGRKVPVENSPTASAASRDSHWRFSVFDHELMTPYSRAIDSPLSIVTIQSMADLGYVVDTSQADEYELPDNAAKRAVDADPWCQVPDIQPVSAP